MGNVRVFTDALELRVFIADVIGAAVIGAEKGIAKGGALMTERARGIVSESRHATGHLEETIDMIEMPAPLGGISRVIVGAGASYSPFVEKDTRPHFPPIAPLIAWATVKGFDDPVGAAWGTARKIAEKGTTGVHFMAASYTFSRDETFGFVAEGVREAVVVLAG